MTETAGNPVAARRILVVGACSAGLAVAAGAFGAHALRDRVEPRLLEVFETAARYQMYHALALLLVGALLGGAPPASARALRGAAGAFMAGTLLFAGSLYAMALTGVRALGAITPLGGVAFLGGWVCVAIAAHRRR